MHKSIIISLKRILIKFIPVKIRIILAYIIQNLTIRFKLRSSQNRSSQTAAWASASTFREKEISASLEFINTAFAQLIKHSGLSLAQIKGKKLLEIGPGENIGLALQFIIAGAAQVVCLDKFYAYRDPEKECKLYQTMRENLSEDQKAYFDSAITLQQGRIEINPGKLICIYGDGIDKSRHLFPAGYFDIIYSNAVLEHVYDLSRAFRVMNYLLKPGGVMMHLVDFKDHGMFSSKNMHALEFLTIPEFIYKLMSRDAALPNRKFINFYKSMLEQLSYESNIHIRQLIKCKEPPVHYLKKIRPRLINQFKSLTDEELLIGVIIISMKKPI